MKAVVQKNQEQWKCALESVIRISAQRTKSDDDTSARGIGQEEKKRLVHEVGVVEIS